MILSREEFRGKWVVLPHLLQSKLLEEKVFEFCAFMYSIDRFKFVVVGLYRSPSCCAEKFTERLSELVVYLSGVCNTVILAGDVNIDVLSNSKEHKIFKNMLASHNMIYLVDFPTRINNNSTKTAIDNFFIKKTDIDRVSVTGVITLLSDHDGQVLTFKNSNSPLNFNNFIFKELRSFSKNNLWLFSKLIDKVSWLEVYLASPAEKYDTFYKLFQFCFEQAFPKRWIKVKTSKRSWITQSLKDEKINLIRLTKEVRKLKNKEKQKKIFQTIAVS
jgi:hypothetical protein